MSTRNQGTWLEREITAINQDYQRRGILTLEKVAPPTVVIHKPRPRVVMLRNPFLDYAGAWTERHGRALFIEAKSTLKPQLPICQEGGITDRQWGNLHTWDLAGAAVGVLWGHDGEIRFCPMPALRAQIREGVKHLKWNNATPVPRGLGFCTWDFVQALRSYYPENRI